MPDSIIWFQPISTEKSNPFICLILIDAVGGGIKGNIGVFCGVVHFF